ncbi:heterokaryon incompatibility protein-domain-containing protein [Scleroderma yunnanense]
MHLINAKAFLKREELFRKKKRVDYRTKVLEFHDEVIDYAILSHRWTRQEVNYDEVVELAKMDKVERNQIRTRAGYQKIVDSCEQAMRDGHEWLWVDTCCIDKRSSAELSESINSMYRWYENSKVCYAYLHDVAGASFPTQGDNSTYPNSNGWPEWFSRGWTLQEMIAPSNVQFFNKHWKPIGDKKRLAYLLSAITQVPELILTEGLSSNRPCTAQILSWAANRTTTRIEDSAYSLLGLLDVNMPMLYGEGKKAFHRLQLEIIRMSDDQSIFAWRGSNRTGSILADDPSFFRGCDEMEIMDHSEFVRSLGKYIPANEPIDEEHFGTFPITNRGIHIWMLLRPFDESNSVFEAWLPCRFHRSDSPIRITLALWKSNYYRYSTSTFEIPHTQRTLRFRQVYLAYHDIPHCDTTFEIDDSAITKNGFKYLGTYPPNTENAFKLTATDPLYVKVYSDSQSGRRIAVGFGQCFGQDWIHFVFENPTNQYLWRTYARFERDNMLLRGPEHAQSMAEVRSGGGRYGRVCVKHTCLLPGSTRTVRTSCVVWESSGNCGVKIEVPRYSYNGPDKWAGFIVGGTDDPRCDMGGLMIPHSPKNLFKSRYTLLVDGVSVEFSQASNGIKLGDYGYLTSSDDFRREGNIFSDLKFIGSELGITPTYHQINQKYGYNTDNNCVEAHNSISYRGPVTLYKPCGLSLPSNPGFTSLLASLSTRLTNRYLVTRVIQCTTVPSSESSRQFSHHPSSHKPLALDSKTPLCTIAKPFVWHQDKGAGSVSMDSWSGDESRAEMKDVEG